jgi:hypothetical protein
MTTLLTAILIMATLGGVLYFGRRGELLDQEEFKNSELQKRSTIRGNFGIKGK